jgi:hypothetical protein
MGRLFATETRHATEIDLFPFFQEGVLNVGMAAEASQADKIME